MKVHQLARGFWEHEPSLSLGCKRLRPLAPKLGGTAADTVATLDLKSFIKPQTGPRKPETCPDDKRDASATNSHQAEVQSGGTRWNPTQEQIGILEMLYRGGMRTPTAQQIEQITAQLGKYGKIEGKNVFYWFQNHKARERQKQKRNSLSVNNTCPRTLAITITAIDANGEAAKEEDSYYKRKCRSWCVSSVEEEKRLCGGFTGGEEKDKTLELFPLHPEGR